VNYGKGTILAGWLYRTARLSHAKVESRVKPHPVVETSQNECLRLPSGTLQILCPIWANQS
jgi:hypothetical protein